MSELINNSRKRVDTLKSLISDINKGVSPEETRKKLMELMGKVPYGEVVQAEEELIREGMSRDDILKHCDLHTEAMKGNIDTAHGKDVPEGHPVHTFEMENMELTKLAGQYKGIKKTLEAMGDNETCEKELLEIKRIFNLFTDVEKHYLKKENLVFPFLEKNEITGPPMVMWGKHDETRAFLKSTLEVLNSLEGDIRAEDLHSLLETIPDTTVKSIEEMIYKEENILFPMCMDTLTTIDWYNVYKQTPEIGYCLYDPQTEWKPDLGGKEADDIPEDGKVRLSTGTFTLAELEAFFGALPLDITFVDKDDNVRYFSHGKERIFHRNRAILGRKVQHCHPPASVNIVDKILDDFKAGKQDSATFWINFKGQYVHIAYYAVKGKEGEYLGTVEVTQDISGYREIEGERRILQYDN